MKFLFLEPFFGGSHRDFAEGLARYSRHEIDLVTLPARFWKWRMRGAALYFIQNVPNLDKYDGLIVSGLMSLSDFKSLAGPSCPPALVYFHENQLTYPLAPGERMDFQYGFTDITTGLAAQKVLFNSRTHLKAFFSALPGFIRMMPEFHPDWAVEAIRLKSGVLYPGCGFSAEMEEKRDFSSGEPPLIIWNHRWEFDKGPEDFFDALNKAADRGADFRLALIGENFQRIPEVFKKAGKRYKDKIVQYGYVKSKTEYYQILAKGNIIISTARQENFGISVIEAMRHGCIPLLPDRLSYPEILPAEFHQDFLYKNQSELIEKLYNLILNYPRFKEKRESLSRAMGKFAWENIIKSYDDILAEMTKV